MADNGAGVYGDYDFKCIVLRDGTVLVVERAAYRGSRTLTSLPNPSAGRTDKPITISLDPLEPKA